MRNQIKVTTILFLLILLSYGGDKMLKIGTEAPQFELKAADGTVFKLSDYTKKKFVVLIFYPGDETPVCTQQLCEIRDDYSSFQKRNAVVFGINPGSDKSHTKFSEKHSFQFPLLIDEKKAVAKLYAAKGAVMNKRTVYVVDKEGNILFAKRGKPPVADILAAIPTDSHTKENKPVELQLKME
jgi:thioredoxin-dependent peroxiredoxin